jgi:hypothetical protein
VDPFKVGAFSRRNVKRPICITRTVGLVFDFDRRSVFAPWKTPDFLNGDEFKLRLRNQRFVHGIAPSFADPLNVGGRAERERAKA